MRQSLNRLLVCHLGLGLTLTLGFLALGRTWTALSFGAGALAMLISCLGMAWSTWRMMDPTQSGLAQKRFALTAAIIVIKYAVLLGSIYYLTQCDWLDPLGFAAGIFSFMIAALMFAAFEYKKETKQFGRAF